MMNTIIFISITLALTNANTLWIPGAIDRLEDDFIIQCVTRGSRCNPSMEEPCCEKNNRCELIGLNQQKTIYVCLRPELLERDCMHDSTCFEFNNARCNGNNKCQCLLNYAVVNKTKCMPLLSGECFENSDCFVDNSICVDSKCVCKPKFVAKSNDQCIQSQLGNSCGNDYDCGDTMHARCSENHVCICRPHHVLINSATCESLLGGYCLRTRECALSESVCIDYKCQCKNGYLFETPDKCVPTPLGKNCRYELDCNEIPFATCSSDEKCICKSGYGDVNRTRCAPLLGNFCFSYELCAADNSVCINNRCQCLPNFVVKDNRCVTENFCSSNNDCRHIWHSECSEKRECVCRRNHILVKSECVPLLGEFCNNGDRCAPENSICRYNECQCDLYYKPIENNQCVPTRLGQRCKVNYDCREINANCSANQICQCTEKHTIFHTFKCRPLLGGFCNKNNSCIVANSVCVNSQCQCNRDYTPVYNDQCLPLWD